MAATATLPSTLPMTAAGRSDAGILVTDTARNHRILVIDDNPSIHEDFRKILCPASADAGLDADEAALFGELQAEGMQVRFEIESAHQGQEGLAMIEQGIRTKRPHAMAFVDVRMPPGWDGVETIGHIWKVYPELQVVICTAYSDYSWEEMTRRLGCSENLLILKKPFDNVEVLQLAHALTEKWRVTRQAAVRMEDLDGLVKRRTAELLTANAKLQQEIRQRAEAQKALQLSEERFSKAFAATPIPLAILAQHDESFLDLNDGFSQMACYGREEVLHRPVKDLPLWAVPAEWQALIRRVQQEGRVRHVSTQLLSKRGEARDTLVSIEPLTVAGQPCLLLLIQDVTERLSLESQLRQSQKMEAVGQLAAGVAHDFNNVLTVIQGHASLQLANERLDREAIDSFEQVRLAAERAAGLTRQLLAFSRKQIMRPRVLDLAELVQNAQQLLSRLLPKNVELRCHCEPHPTSIQGDETGMQQVLMNLVVNARDALAGAGTIEIRTQTIELTETDLTGHLEARTGRFVRLTVADTGCGMDPTVQSRMFEPFFTTKDVGQGTGLGLSTVYGIVKQHRGWVEVLSSVGNGTTFHIFLPFCEGLPDSEGSTCFVKKTGNPQGTETILLVEDDAALLRLAGQTLRRSGYEVLEAADGPDALRVWQEATRPVDLLLTDASLPGGLSGTALAGRLRTLKPDLKVLLTSGYSASLMDSKWLLLEGVNYLQKPYDPKVLLETVRHGLDAIDVPNHTPAPRDYVAVR